MAPKPKAPAVRAPRAVGVKRASQRKGWVPPTPEQIERDRQAREHAQRDAENAARLREQLAVFGDLDLRPLESELVGKPTRLDPKGVTKGGGYWVAELAKTGRKVQAVKYDTETRQLVQDEIYPCKCDESRARSYGKGCSRKWCECSGRVILPNSREDRELPADCCARGVNSVETLRYEQDELEIAKRHIIEQNKRKGAYSGTQDSTLAEDGQNVPGGIDRSDAGESSPRDAGEPARGESPASTAGDVEARQTDSKNTATKLAGESETGEESGQIVWGVGWERPDSDQWEEMAVTSEYSGEYSTYLDRLEFASERLEAERLAEQRQGYADALEAARERIAKDACHCPTPWDGEARNASTGLHCVGCHENFATIMAYDMHRRGIWDKCVDPEDIVNRKEWGGTGKKLMILGAKNGKPIWSMGRP